MKRYGNLWNKIIDINNIKIAHVQARKGKLHYEEVKEVDKDVLSYCKKIQDMLVNKTFSTSEYEVCEKNDGKKIRTIYKLPYYPDRIVQHALLQVLKPIFVKSFIRDSFQSIDNRGTMDACKRVKKIIRSKNSPKYALKIDVNKYYPSIDNDLMKKCVREKIKCKDTLWLVDNIIDSTKGMPIGNYTSQYFGNLYLNNFDWYVKQNIKPSGYFRYCDDILFLSNSIFKLLYIKMIAIKELKKLKLSIKNNWNIFNIKKNGVDFVGYVFFPDKTLLRKSIRNNFKRKIKYIRNVVTRKNSEKYLSSLMSYKGWVNTINAKALWRKYTKSLITFYPKQLRKAI